MQSLFLQFIEKWFPSLRKIVEKVNGERDGKSRMTYLHKEMLRKEFSIDQKWESASVNTTYVAADIVAMDSPLPIKKRDSIAASNGSLPKMGMMKQMRETELNAMMLMEAKGGNEAQIKAKLVSDAVACVTGIDERNEATFLTGLCEGIVLVEDADNVGAGIRVNFNYLDSNKFGVVTKWGKPGFTPISDLKRVIEASDSDVSVIMLSKVTYDLIRQSEEAKELSANYGGVLVLENSKLPTPLPDKFNSAFQSETGCAFKVVDRTVRIEKNGKVTKIRPWNDNRIILLPSEQVGALVYGRLVEETKPVANVSYTKANEYTLVSKYSLNLPFLQEFTSAQALCLPVIENVDQIYILDISEAQEVDESEAEGDATITIWEATYNKADVIAALNVMDKTTTDTITDASLIAKINKLSDADEAALQDALTPNP